MKQKGFSLVELLGVIVILGILATIIYPIVNKKINASKEDLYTSQIDLIETGARNWGAEHLGELPTYEGESVRITLLELQNEGYVPEKLENPKTGEMFPSDIAVIIRMEQNSLEYQVVGI